MSKRGKKIRMKKMGKKGFAGESKGEITSARVSKEKKVNEKRV